MTFKKFISRIKNKFKSQSGMTLLEVVLTMALAGASASVLVATFMQAVHTQERLNGRVTAQILGAAKMAELTGGGEMGNSGVFSEPYQKYSWVAREEKTEAGASMIFLTVEWSRGDETAQKTFRGYREPEYDDLN